MVQPIKYNFIQDKPDDKPLDFAFYYQICALPDELTKKYHMKKFTVGGRNCISKVEEYQLSELNLKKFIKLRKPNEYKFFPQFSLEDVHAPTPAQLTMLRSEILSGDQSCGNYAKF